MENNNPVAGPGILVPVIATCTIPGPSCGEHEVAVPITLVPLIQTIVIEPPPWIAPPSPEIPTPTGVRIELSVLTRMSKPLRVAEFCMLTLVVTKVPVVPMTTVPVGHEFDPGGAMHTVPTEVEP